MENNKLDNNENKCIKVCIDKGDDDDCKMNGKADGKSITYGHAFGNILNKDILNIAIGFIIATALSAVITSLVNDILLPLISLIGHVQLHDLMIIFHRPTTLSNGQPFPTNISYELAKSEGIAALYYGEFIEIVIDFIIIALIMAMLIYSIAAVKCRISKNKDKK